jgi:hypothetical protein
LMTDGWVLWAHLADPRGGSSLYSIAIAPHADEAGMGSSGIVWPMRFISSTRWRIGPDAVVGGTMVGEIELVDVPVITPWDRSARHTIGGVP